MKSGRLFGPPSQQFVSDRPLHQEVRQNGRRIEGFAGDLDPGHGESYRVQQPQLHQCRRLVPVEVLTFHLLVIAALFLDSSKILEILYESSDGEECAELPRLCAVEHASQWFLGASIARGLSAWRRS